MSEISGIGSPQRQAQGRPQSLAGHLAVRGWDKLSLYSPHFVSSLTRYARDVADFSVVVIAANVTAETYSCITEIARQRDAGIELVFVDNGCGNAISEDISRVADTFVRLNNNTGAYLARNVGAVFSHGERLIFLDDDARPAENFIRAYRNVFEAFDVICVRGLVLPKTDTPLNAYARHYNLGNRPFARFNDFEGNMAVSTDAFFAVGGWDDAIRFGHGGIDLSYRFLTRYGNPAQLIYTPEPVVYHDYGKGENQFQDKLAKQARGWEYLRSKHSDIDSFLPYWETLRNLPLIRKKSAFDKGAKAPSLSNLAEHYRRRGNLEKYEHYKAQAIAAGETINQPQRDAEIVE